MCPSAIPNPALGLKMYPSHFRATIQLRLGLPVLTSRHRCDCQTTPDIFGTHSLCCTKGPERTARHNSIRNVIHQTCIAAGLSASLEPPHLLSNSEHRPGDIFIRDWSCGKSIAMDVTVSCTLQQSNLDKAAAHDRFHAQDADTRKRRLLAKVYDGSGFIFQPMSFESTGGMTSATEETLKTIATFWGARQGIERHTAIPWLFQKVSMALQRGNADMIARHLSLPFHQIYRWIE